MKMAAKRGSKRRYKPRKSNPGKKLWLKVKKGVKNGQKKKMLQSKKSKRTHTKR